MVFHFASLDAATAPLRSDHVARARWTTWGSQWLLPRAAVAAALCSALGCASRKGLESAADRERGADSHYDVAVGSFHNGMFEDAKIQLDKALRVDPEHADSHYLKGLLLLNEGRTLVNAVEIDQCLTDAAADIQRERAESLHAEAQTAFDVAAGTYEEGAAGRGRAFNSLAVVALYFQRYEEAIAQAKAALEQQFYTDRYSALANMGWAHYLQGDLVSATAELREAVLINPDYCVGHYRLAQVYLDSGLPESALEHATAVVEHERCPIQDAHRIVGVVYRRLGKETEATTALQRCVSLAPRSCLARDCERLLGPDGGVPASETASVPVATHSAP